MNEQDLIISIAEKTGLTEKDAHSSLNAMLDTIVDAVAEGDDVALVGFGQFGSKSRVARTRRNPQTGEPLKIRARIVPSFKADKLFVDAVDK